MTLTVLFSACEFKLKPNEEEGVSSTLQVQRYDRLESRYLTTGDFSALQQMNTAYPMQTRTLIEDMLELGEV
ncbi:MAG: gliding motility protein GldB, partial [Prevotella sp.]|nr:gliding motility protein GldB [Prevotella sp.]